MPLATRRSYAGAAPACTLSSDISAGATSFSITGTTTNWPTTATGPFYMVIDPGLSTEEKVLVGARTSGSLSSVTRGVDGTTAASHVTGATCYPVFTAVDANDANLLASRLSAKGDLISSDGSDPTKVAVGANNTRLVADSAQTSGMKWVADTQNTVVDAKGDLLVGTAADTIARLAIGTNGHVLTADSGETTGTKWTNKPTGLAWGHVADAGSYATTAFSAATTLTIHTVTATIEPSRRYLIFGRAGVQVTGAAATSNALWVEETTLGKRTIGYDTAAITQYYCKLFEGSFVCISSDFGVTSSSASKTIYLKWRCGASGALNPDPDAIVGANSLPHQLTIIDIGPA